MMEPQLKNPQGDGALAIARVFLRLGLTSFGGPLAHVGYVRREVVERRAWVDEALFAELLALCQMLPGPSSSQLVFCLGLKRGGYAGAFAGFLAFALPSAVVMTVLGTLALRPDTQPPGFLVHGLQLAAVGVVAQAVLAMARTLTPDVPRVLIGLAALAAALWLARPGAQLLLIAGGALAGVLVCRASVSRAPPHIEAVAVSHRVAVLALTVFVALLAVLPVLVRASPAHSVALFAATYRSGALVFGGGHVMLPLLRAGFVPPGWITDAQFLAGYGAAQALPGPLFTFAGYLGAISAPQPHGVAGALIALAGIFLPGVLLVLAALPFWDAVRGRTGARAALAGINAAVVGLLAAALCTPVWTGAVHRLPDALLALAAFLLLVPARLPPWAVVALTVAGAAALGN